MFLGHAILADKVATTSSSSPTKPFFYSSLDGLDKVSSSYCTLSRTCPSPIAGMSAYSSQAPSETLLDYSKNKAITSQIDAALQKVDIIEILENGGNLRYVNLVSFSFTRKIPKKKDLQ